MASGMETRQGQQVVSAGVDVTIDETSDSSKPLAAHTVGNSERNPSALSRALRGDSEADRRHAELGIPTWSGSAIWQALLQVLQPMIDPTFSKFSYSFAQVGVLHDAVL